MYAILVFDMTPTSVHDPGNNCRCENCSEPSVPNLQTQNGSWEPCDPGSITTYWRIPAVQIKERQIITFLFAHNK